MALLSTPKTDYIRVCLGWREQFLLLMGGFLDVPTDLCTE
jgi:hypothetical protein